MPEDNTVPRTQYDALKAQYDALKDRYQQSLDEIRWIVNLMSNPNMDATQKVLQWGLRQEVLYKQKHATEAREDNLAPIYLPNIEKSTGLPRKTISRLIPRLTTGTAGIVYKTEKVSQGKGHVRVHSYAGLTPAGYQAPATIAPEATPKPGGNKRFVCPDCHQEAAGILRTKKEFHCSGCGAVSSLSTIDRIINPEAAVSLAHEEREEYYQDLIALEDQEIQECEQDYHAAIAEHEFQEEQSAPAVEIAPEPSAPVPPLRCRNCGNTNPLRWIINQMRNRWKCQDCWEHAPFAVYIERAG